jgi:hypothetical protein
MSALLSLNSFMEMLPQGRVKVVRFTKRLADETTGTTYSFTSSNCRARVSTASIPTSLVEFDIGANPRTGKPAAQKVHVLSTRVVFGQ